MTTSTIKVPDIGDFGDIPIIEILVSVGDHVQQDQSLLTLESDKATMEVPAPADGTLTKLLVAVGDNVSTGTVIAEFETAGEESNTIEQTESESPSDSDSTSAASGDDFDCDVLVLGAGPGGYSAAFRAADLGLDVVLIERDPFLGGVCLNVGCIPSKALLHTARVLDEAKHMSKHGIRFGEPDIELDKLRDWKNSVVKRLTNGLEGLAKQRKVRVITGYGEFSGSHEMTVTGLDGKHTIRFANAIIAAGSEPVHLPNMPWDDPRLMNSTGALELNDIPGKLLVIGGGIIGLEMACVYAALGSAVTVVELMDQLMPGTDKDLVKPLQKILSQRCEEICLKTKVETVIANDNAMQVTYSGDKIPATTEFDRILVSVGRVPNGRGISADKAGVNVTERGFIEVDKQQRTNVSHIFAIGDVVGQPMLAHKATHEAKVAAEVIAGEASYFDANVIPSVAYTDPEVAWVGVTESHAKEHNIAIETAKFPWAASGRALGMDRDEGFTKLIFDANSQRVIGAGIVGPHAGDLIAECSLAIEMGCDAEDIGLTIHPHPTLSETIGMTAEAFTGTLTDLYMPKKKK